MNIHQVEQGTKEWLDLKKGRVTGTRLKEVMGRSPKKLMYEMIAEKYDSTPGYQTSAMSEGTLKEPWAVDQYQEETGQTVKEIGFISNGPDIGLSPDGMVGKRKAIEVKCPSLPKHIEYIVNGIPSEYLWQIVHYFVVIEDLEELDFVSYHPNFPIKELHIVNIKREALAEKILEAKTKLETFLKEYNQLNAQLF